MALYARRPVGASQKTFYHRGHRGQGEKRSGHAPQSANPYPRYYCNKTRPKDFLPQRTQRKGRKAVWKCAILATKSAIFRHNPPKTFYHRGRRGQGEKRSGSASYLRQNPPLSATICHKPPKIFYHRGHRGKGEKRSGNAPQSANPYPRYYCNKTRHKDFLPQRAQRTGRKAVRKCGAAF